jgi:O-Antigen ligase
MRRQGASVASAAVSSVVTAAPGSEPADTSAAGRAPTQSRRPSPDLLIALLLAAAIVALAMISAGGVDNLVATSGNTWTEIAVTVLGATTVGVVVVIGPPGRHWGSVTILLMATLTLLEGLSITWSYLPDSSWLATSQAVSFLAAFAAAVCLAWVAPNRWPALLGGFAIAMTALCGWSLLVKVFPSTLAPSGSPGRLEAPFGYWNAIGLCAALGLPACLWGGARRDAGRLLAGLAAPALCLLLSVAVLSYSRSADAAGVVAVALWLIFVPLRLRSVLMLAIGAIGAAVISAWMLTHGALTNGSATTAAQDHAGHTFGIVIVVVLVLVTAAGFWAGRAMDRVTLPAALRRQIGWALIALLVVGVVCALGATALSSRGLTDELSHVWKQLTATDSHVSDSAAGRVFQFGSSRPVYWHQAIDVGEHALFKGVGLLGFADARLRYTTSASVVSEAHGYLFETFADLGLLGVVVTLGLLASWLVAAWRPLALRTRTASLDPEQSAERAGMVALASIVIAFGVQSTLDWTWFFSGLTVPVLLCAGWLAGRGPLVTANPRVTPAPESERATGWLDRLAARPAASATVILLVAATILIGWTQWRPLHAAQQLTRSESASSTAAAFPLARSATSSDPLSIAPYPWLCGLDMDIHDRSAARAELVKARNLQPQNPVTWLNLGLFDFHHRQIAIAQPEFQRALDLDLTLDTTRITGISGVLQSQAILAGKQQPPANASYCLPPS